MTLDPAPINSTTFKVTLTGIREDIPVEVSRHAFARLFKVEPQQIDTLFKSLPRVLKKKIQADQASRYKAAIENAGGICRIEEDGPLMAAVIQAPPPTLKDVKPPVAFMPPASAQNTHPHSPNIRPLDMKPPGPMAGVARKIVWEVRNFLLLDIPKRSIALDFKLPSPSARAKVGSRSSAELYESDNDPLEFLKLLHARIKFLNFAKLATSARLRANHDLLKKFYPVAIPLLVELAKADGIPESEHRRQALMVTNDIASILVTSYAFVFANYYEGSKHHYARHRKQVPELASCIFELLLLKQRARALRYQMLEPNDWSMANTVFYVMRAYEDAQRAMPTLASELNMDTLRGKKSLTDQFILLQIQAWFDLLRLPTHLQWVIGSYVLKVENAVRLREDTGALNTNEMLVYCYGKQAAETRRLDIPAGPALVLNLHHLVEAIHEDCKARGTTNTRDASPAMPRFAHFETADHFVIRNQLLSRLTPKEDSVVSAAEQQVDGLRIFAGFSAVFALLRHQKSEFGSEERLEDRLSNRSAAFAIDGREIRKSLWSFSFQSENMTRFTTTESKDTNAMGIGMLLAYGVADEVNRPRLAVVSRISRPYGKALELDMRFIASFCEPVILDFNTVKVPGLMLYDPRDGGHWALAFPPRDVLMGIDKVEIHRNKKVVSVELTRILDASSDFYLFETTLTSSQLGFYSVPQYPVAVVRQTPLRIF